MKERERILEPCKWYAASEMFLEVGGKRAGWAFSISAVLFLPNLNDRQNNVVIGLLCF
jgi:hypothetical protein